MGGAEIIVVILVVLLLFGAKSIPDMARMLGKGMNEFRRASDEIKREFRENTSDITDVVEETKKELHEEGKQVTNTIEEETADLDPYNLNEEETESESTKQGKEVPPTSPDGPVSREDSVDI